MLEPVTSTAKLLWQPAHRVRLLWLPGGRYYQQHSALGKQKRHSRNPGEQPSSFQQTLKIIRQGKEPQLHFSHLQAPIRLESFLHGGREQKLGNLTVAFKASAEGTYQGAGDVPGLEEQGQLATVEHWEVPLLPAVSQQDRGSPTSHGGALSGFRQPPSLSATL